MDSTLNATRLIEKPRCEAPVGLKWACLEKGAPVSRGLPHTGIMLVTCLVVFGLIKQFALEETLMRKREIYKKTWKRLSHRDQRTLVNHHLSLGIKSFILVVALVPFMLIVAGHQFSYSPIPNSRISVGDMMFVVSNIYTAMYAFELCYRTGISPIAWLHHTGTAVMAQYALLLSRDKRHSDGSIELILCLIWGLFDIVSEAIPHLTFILYRLFPTAHSSLYRWFTIATLVMVSSTLLETAIILWIYVALFKRWRTDLKIVTPVMHLLFTSAQLWGARALRGLAQREKKLIQQEQNGASNLICDNHPQTLEGDGRAGKVL
ncbi:hypothetical protein DM02DRAFT_130974 [Periconia macrospinosa]|uniref:TLC domain-containing protein n=1 Tax=Periconia macrospinosa TaxID=97972 RepID=A0A2V1DDF1_9PLEO|nr:hypothetical protein DM02DRAFT_130974 [Periconia macrospinosa]